MFRPRVIPVLLLKGNVLYKSVQFGKHKYIGDPINAVKIFNNFGADELVFLDIDASREKRLISLDFIRNVGEEADMPFAAGGGIRTLDDIREVINAGAEKVVIGTAAALDPDFISAAADKFATSTVCVCIDVKKNFLGKKTARVLNASKNAGLPPLELAQLMEKKGAGEIIIQSVDHDGMMGGYDIDLINEISKAVTIPVIALGGAGKLDHMAAAFRRGHANGLAAGSMFVYQGSKRGVLVNYPERHELKF